MITLNSGIMWQLMAEITAVLKDHEDWELSHFEAVQDEEQGVYELLAHYPASGIQPEVCVVILAYPSDQCKSCEQMAEDLNTLFNLEVPAWAH